MPIHKQSNVSFDRRKDFWVAMNQVIRVTTLLAATMTAVPATAQAIFEYRDMLFATAEFDSILDAVTPANSQGLIPILGYDDCPLDGPTSAGGDAEFDSILDAVTPANSECLIPILGYDDCPPDGPTSDGGDDDECTPQSMGLLLASVDASWALVSLGERSISVFALPEEGTLFHFVEELLAEMEDIGASPAVADEDTTDYLRLLRDALSEEEPWIDNDLNAGRKLFLLHRD